MSHLPNHEGNTFEPTRRWRPAAVVIDALLSVAILLLIAGLAFVSWRAIEQKSDAFAAAKVGRFEVRQSATGFTTAIASMGRASGTMGDLA